MDDWVLAANQYLTPEVHMWRILPDPVFWMTWMHPMLQTFKWEVEAVESAIRQNAKFNMLDVSRMCRAPGGWKPAFKEALASSMASHVARLGVCFIQDEQLNRLKQWDRQQNSLRFKTKCSSTTVSSVENSGQNSLMSENLPTFASIVGPMDGNHAKECRDTPDQPKPQEQNQN